MWELSNNETMSCTINCTKVFISSRYIYKSNTNTNKLTYRVILPWTMQSSSNSRLLNSINPHLYETNCQKSLTTNSNSKSKQLWLRSYAAPYRATHCVVPRKRTGWQPIKNCGGSTRVKIITDRLRGFPTLNDSRKNEWLLNFKFKLNYLKFSFRCKKATVELAATLCFNMSFGPACRFLTYFFFFKVEKNQKNAK